MRVLLISHTCQSRTEGQPKAQELGRHVELSVLVPDRFFMYGQWKHAEVPAPGASFAFHIGRTRLCRAGPAGCYLQHYRHLGQLLTQVRPHVIDLWEEPWSLASVQAIRLCRRHAPHARIVCETEQNVDKQLPWPFEAFRRYSLRHADHVIGRNPEALEIVRRRGYHGAASVVPNAFDDQLFRPLDRQPIRSALGLDGFVVAYVGRLVEEKGLLELVAACEQLRGRHGDVRLLLVGAGPLHERLAAISRQPQWGGAMHLLGAQPLQKLPEFMNAADVLVLPSRTTTRWKEQFGRVIIEAHGCGTPVVGSTSGAIPSVVGPGGLIFPEQDVDALARALARLRDNDAERVRLGAVGRERALRQFTWRAVATRMASIYRQLGGEVARGASGPALAGDALGADVYASSL